MSEAHLEVVEVVRVSKTALGVVSGLRLSLRVIYSETEITEVIKSVKL